MSEKKYNYFYKITNLINNHFYYGIHSTNDINDGYMGSGKRLHYAYEKYGIENFKKENLKFFDTFIDACNYEREIVNKELVEDPKCYNMILGGYYLFDKDKLSKSLSEANSGENNSQFGKRWITNGIISKSVFNDEIDFYLTNGWTFGRNIKNTEKLIKANKNRVWVCNKNNEVHFIQKDNLQHYLDNGFIIGRTFYKPEKIKKPFVPHIKVIDNNGNIFTVYQNDERYISGELIPYNRGKIAAVDANGNKLGLISTNNPKYLSGEYKAIHMPTTFGKVIVKDKNGKTYTVDKNDERYLSGELVGINKGKHWKQHKK